MYTNIAYTEKYRERRRRLDAVFAPGYRCDEPEIVRPLTEDISLRQQLYSGEVGGQKIGIACECELLDRDGNTIYSWHSFDSSDAFLGFSWFSGDKSYLMFRRELYGYSILELHTGREFHYVPSCAFPEDGEEFEETFIWGAADYDAKTGLLAVAGCYWGCPSSTVILDFSDMFAEHPADEWLNIADLLPPGAHIGAHITPDRWDNGDLILERYKPDMSRPELLRVPGHELKAALDRMQTK